MPRPVYNNDLEEGFLMFLTCCGARRSPISRSESAGETNGMLMVDGDEAAESGRERGRENQVKDLVTYGGWQQ